nr:hypothetical protein Iba_chr04cCG14440 [Ipomoea batatas]
MPPSINSKLLRLSAKPSQSLEVVMDQKKPDTETPKRRSKRLAELARLEMLRQRKIAHGGHETEGGTMVLVPPKVEVLSLANSDYDSNYLDFLSEMEVGAKDSPPNTLPVPLKIEADEWDSSHVPLIPALPWTEPPSPPGPLALTPQEDPQLDETVPHTDK